MAKILKILLTVIITSMFLFPFAPVFLYGINTKIVLGAVAVAILIADLSRKRKGTIDKEFLLLFGYSLLVSFAFLFAVFYNNTTDYTYVSYVVSMVAWTAGAFSSVSMMRHVHGRVSVPIVVYYLAGACTMQCILAFLIARYAVVESYCSLLDQNIPGNLEHGEGRLFGVGCAFDVGGMRLAAVLVMMGFFFPDMVKKFEKKRIVIVAFLLSFFIISILGNMIARTTSVGLAIALGYMVIYSIIHASNNAGGENAAGKWLLGMLVCSVAIATFLYRMDSEFHKNFRFAFEGFFSLVEKGRWETNSNDILATMYRWPKTLKTWIIGDGYFYNTNLDPYYVGKTYTQYYMATDVGYIRFIYYGGIVSLGTFILFMCKATAICVNKFSNYKLMFFLLLMLQFLIWGKVASDIYAIFGIFITMSYYMERKTNASERKITVD